MKEIDKGVLEETKIIKFGGGKVEQKRKWRERESWREEKMEKMKTQDSEGQTSSNNNFHILNNNSAIYTLFHPYIFQKTPNNNSQTNLPNISEIYI